MQQRMHAIPSVFLVVALAGCASPTRDQPEKFALLQEGKIPPTSAQAFADCLVDGFDKAHFVLTEISSRQQRRSSMYRVETLVRGRMVMISADVGDDGRVQLFESSAAGLVNTSGEKAAFAECLAKYGPT